DAEEVAVQIVVQEHQLFGRLNDLLRRTDARHTRRLTVPGGIHLDLSLVEILDLGDVRRLVDRSPRIELGDADRFRDRRIVGLAWLELRNRWTNPVMPL